MKLRSDAETGWLIERAHQFGSQYLCSICGALTWSNFHEWAIRFARESDALAMRDALAVSLPDLVDGYENVTEHIWC